MRHARTVALAVLTLALAGCANTDTGVPDAGHQVCAEVARDDGILAVTTTPPADGDEWESWFTEVHRLGEQATEVPELREAGEAILTVLPDDPGRWYMPLPDGQSRTQQAIALTWQLGAACVDGGYLTRDDTREAFNLPDSG